MNYVEFEKLKYTGSSGNTLQYRLLKPLEYDASRQYPLVLFLHGSGERGSDNEMPLDYIAPLFLKPENRKKFPCFLIVPQCPWEDRWAHMDRHHGDIRFQENPSTSIQLTIDLLKETIEKHSIDDHRVYVIGLSMGGCGTFDILIREPQLFAAAIPICGWCDTRKAEVIKNIPLWNFHGSSDTTVDVNLSRDLMEVLKKAGGSPKYTEYPGVRHESWEKAYKEPELLPWLFSQKKIN